MTLRIIRGFDESERPEAARLFWQAFAAKLGRVLGPEDRALRFLHPALDPRFALGARDGKGQMLGLAGFKTAEGGLVDAGMGDLARVYGWVGALWRGPLLELLERPLQPGVFQMDGIFVDERARGQGVGSALLAAIRAEAERSGAGEVQLDVIDSNPRAKALYERVGFVATGTEHTGPLAWVFGFRSATRMRLPLTG